MCVIIHKPEGVEVTPKDIKGAFETNPDGFGVMFYDKAQDRIIGKKGVFKNIKKIMAVFNTLRETEAIYHFRIKTHGSICNEQCHPFQICSKDRDGMDIFFMHNGTIHKQKGQAGESDTQMFCNAFLKPLLQPNPNFIKTEAFKDLIESYIGGYNKLAFMYEDGKILRLNDMNWQEHEGLRCSNKHFVPWTKRNYNTNYVNSHWDDVKKEWVPNDTKKDTSNVTMLEHHKKNVSYFFCGQTIEVGDSVLVTNKDEEKWYAEGTIESISALTFAVRFKNRVDNIMTLAFELSTGDAAYLQSGYQCVLMSRKSSDIDKTIEDITTKALEEEEAEDKALDIQEKKKEEKVVSEKQPLVAKTSAGTSLSVSHSGRTIDIKQRWASGFSDSTQEFCDGTTVLDVYNMNDEDRFRFFLDNMETSYNMFLDMMEKIVTDDIDDGLINSDDDADDTETGELSAEMQEYYMYGCI